jgi:branched-subunit amino acid aminotransferase/4-amino-4-deoxychorismate lyase
MADQPPAARPDDLWWADPPLRQRIAADPAAALRDLGVNPPPGLPVPVVLEVLRTLSVIWYDGRVIAKSQFRIDPADEGLLFGRGLWESTRTVNGLPWLWPLHIDRLLRTAVALEIDVAPARLPDVKQVAEFVRMLTAQDVVIRLNVTAGPPGRPGLVWMTAGLRPTPVQSVRLQSCRGPVLRNQPYLAGKTFQYASRLRTGQQAHRAGYDSALMLDEHDNVLEAAHANLFVRFADGWVTPPADSGLLLPGTVRQHILASAPIQVREEVLPAARLGEVREAFVTNSNVGLVPVVQMDAHTYPIGEETRTLMRWALPEAAGVRV